MLSLSPGLWHTCAQCEISQLRRDKTFRSWYLPKSYVIFPICRLQELCFLELRVDKTAVLWT